MIAFIENCILFLFSNPINSGATEKPQTRTEWELCKMAEKEFQDQTEISLP